MYLDIIVSYINEQLKVRLGAKAAQSRFYGVCKLVEKDNEDKTVVLYDNAGSDTVVIDDSYTLFAYHRFLGWSMLSNEQNAANSYGDGASTKSGFANFIMAVYADRARLNLTDQELTASVVFNFPDVLPQYLTAQLDGMKLCVVSPTGTNNNNAEEGERLKLEKENIFFTVNYRVAITGDVTCLADCEPDCI